LSRKQRKKLHRLSVAELKQLVQRPEVVEAHDVTAADPRLLVHLKAYRGTVPVPRHWCHKRKYLQASRRRRGRDLFFCWQARRGEAALAAAGLHRADGHLQAAGRPGGAGRHEAGQAEAARARAAQDGQDRH
ncbi:unnamed protein product, partial [Heterosigma akashiwo]